MHARSAHPATRRRPPGFTLIELLVVVAVIAVLVSLLLPALASARRAARAVACAANMRSIGQAHVLYINDHNGRFIDFGLPHAAIGGSGEIAKAWPVTLAEDYGTPLVLRSPADDSSAWPVDQGGTSTDLSLTQYLGLLEQNASTPGAPPIANVRIARWTSYGLNLFVTPSFTVSSTVPGLARAGQRFDRIHLIPSPAGTVHFVMIAPEGDNSTSDHVHPENWAPIFDPALAPQNAAHDMFTNAHGGPPGSSSSRSNYLFLDGHASTLRFDQVWPSRDRNRFFPPLAF